MCPRHAVRCDDRGCRGPPPPLQAPQQRARVVAEDASARARTLHAGTTRKTARRAPAQRGCARRRPAAAPSARTDRGAVYQRARDAARRCRARVRARSRARPLERGGLGRLRRSATPQAPRPCRQRGGNAPAGEGTHDDLTPPDVRPLPAPHHPASSFAVGHGCHGPTYCHGPQHGSQPNIVTLILFSICTGKLKKKLERGFFCDKFTTRYHMSRESGVRADRRHFFPISPI